MGKAHAQARESRKSALKKTPTPPTGGGDHMKPIKKISKAKEAQERQNAKDTKKKKTNGEEAAKVKEKKDEQLKRKAEAKAEEAEAKRKKEESEAKKMKKKEEAEAKRKKEEAEAKRKDESEAKKKKKEEAEAKRKKEEAEEKRKQEEAEANRKKEESEAKKKKKKEEAEAKRKKEEAEEKRKQEEAEAKRRKEESEAKKKKKKEEAAAKAEQSGYVTPPAKRHSFKSPDSVTSAESQADAEVARITASQAEAQDALNVKSGLQKALQKATIEAELNAAGMDAYLEYCVKADPEGTAEEALCRSMTRTKGDEKRKTLPKDSALEEQVKKQRREKAAKAEEQEEEEDEEEEEDGSSIETEEADEEEEEEEEEDEAKDEAKDEDEVVCPQAGETSSQDDGSEFEEEEEDEEDQSEYDSSESGEEEEPQDKGTKVTETAMVPVSPKLAEAGAAAAEISQQLMVRNSVTHKKEWDTFMRQVANRTLFPTQLAPHFLKSKQDLFSSWLDCGQSWDKVLLDVERKQETLNLSRSEMTAVKAKDIKKTMSKEKFDKLWASRKSSGLYYIDKDFPDDEEDRIQTGTWKDYGIEGGGFWNHSYYRYWKIVSIPTS